jgi:hypothetical protein
MTGSAGAPLAASAHDCGGAQWHVGMVVAERLLSDRERALIQRLRLGVAALRAIQLGEVAERRAGIRVGGALLADRKRALYSGSASA